MDIWQKNRGLLSNNTKIKIQISMKKNLLFSSILLTLLFAMSSCSSPQEKMTKEINTLEKSLYADSSMVPDTASASKIIKLYLAYAEQFPADTSSPNYLFKAGDIAAKINETQTAIDIFQKLKTNFPNHRNAAYALFLQGFISETQEGNPGKAKPYYEEFLKKYPDHAIAPDVAFSLENLGKTPEELIMEFEKNNALTDSAAIAVLPAK